MPWSDESDYPRHILHDYSKIVDLYKWNDPRVTLVIRVKSGLWTCKSVQVATGNAVIKL